MANSSESAIPSLRYNNYIIKYELCKNIFSILTLPITTFSILIPPADLLLFYQRIGDQLTSCQILPVHIHSADLVIVIGIILVDSLIRITTGGIQRDLILVLPKLAAASLLIHRPQNMEKLADTFPFRIS